MGVLLWKKKNKNPQLGGKVAVSKSVETPVWNSAGQSSSGFSWSAWWTPGGLKYKTSLFPRGETEAQCLIWQRLQSKLMAREWQSWAMVSESTQRKWTQTVFFPVPFLSLCCSRAQILHKFPATNLFAGLQINSEGWRGQRKMSWLNFFLAHYCKDLSNKKLPLSSVMCFLGLWGSC